MSKTQIEFASRQDAASVHLKYKIDKNLDANASLGLMTVEDVSEKILKSIYPTEDVETAVNDAVKTGHMNLYYNVCCGFCGKETPFIELDEFSKETWKFLFNEGERCMHCGRNIIGSVKNISRRFAISSFKLSKNEDALEEQTILQRLIAWLFLKKKHK
jgi:hypothetical protein